jgi:hypothetical protein
MSKERAAKIANSPDASRHGGKKSGSGGNSSQGGTTAEKKKAGRKGGRPRPASREHRVGPSRRRAALAAVQHCARGWACHHWTHGASAALRPRVVAESDGR